MHVALFGKLNGVTDKIYKALMQPNGVGSDGGRQPGLTHDVEFKPFLFSLQTHQRVDIAKYLAERAVDYIDIEFAGVYFREVQNVIYQRQQTIA